MKEGLSKIKIDLSACQMPRIYKRNGQDCYFDLVREFFIISTPEELVRQQLISFLIDKLKVPKTNIEVEVPMCHFEKGSRGRADIVVYGLDEDGSTLVPALLIECKAPFVSLTDDVVDQIARYNRCVRAGILMITNGQEAVIWAYEENNQEYMELVELPNYHNLVQRQNLKIDTSPPENWVRPPFNQITHDVITGFIERNWLYEGSNKEIRSFIINLAGLFMDISQKLKPCEFDGISVIEDGGVRNTSFGNAAGGVWTGNYRYFIIQDSNRNNQIISISIMAASGYDNDDVFGNRKGRTVLIVAIDDFKKRHNSLQLNLDKYSLVENGEVKIWHDGTLTMGKRGAAKKQEVINYIEAKSPDLIDHNQVILGSFPVDKEITWNDSGVSFLNKLMKYAIMRDQFRKAHEPQITPIVYSNSFRAPREKIIFDLE